MQRFLDGKTAIYRSAHQYLDRNDPLKGPKYVEREHPIVRTHPVTGWKYLFVNRGMTVRIVGLLPEESDLILNYLFSIIETNRDIQVRWSWQKELGSVKRITTKMNNQNNTVVLVPYGIIELVTIVLSIVKNQLLVDMVLESLH